MARLNTPGAQLAIRRKANLLFQRAMAERLQISPQTVVRLETQFRGRVVALRPYLRVLGVTDILAVALRGKRLVPDGNEPDADLVFTSNALAWQIIATLAEDIAGEVLDQARGGGTFYDALSVSVTKHWCDAADSRDFFDWRTPVDRIVTNPPWSSFSTGSHACDAGRQECSVSGSVQSLCDARTCRDDQGQRF